MASRYKAGQTVKAQGLSMTIIHCAKNFKPRKPSAKKGSVRPTDVWVLESSKRKFDRLDRTAYGWLLCEKGDATEYWRRVKMADLNWEEWGGHKEEVVEKALDNNNVGNTLADKYFLPPNIYDKAKERKAEYTTGGMMGGTVTDTKSLCASVEALEAKQDDKDQWAFLDGFPTEDNNHDYPIKKFVTDMASQSDYFERRGGRIKDSIDNKDGAAHFVLKSLYESAQSLTKENDLSFHGIEDLFKNTEYQAAPEKKQKLMQAIGRHAAAIKWLRFDVLHDTERCDSDLDEMGDDELAF